MTFGRPSAIPNNYVKLDLPVINDSVDTSAVMDKESTSLGLSFFNSTM